MKLAYVYGTEETIAPVLGFQGDPHQIFPFLKQNGYDAIEPFVRNPKLFNIADFEKTVNLYGMGVIAIGTGPVVSDDKLTFTNQNQEVRLAAVQRVKDIVDFASCFNAPVNIGKLRGDIDEIQLKQTCKWMKECFLEVCEYADKRGISILLEPQNKKSINNLNTTNSALQFIEEIDAPNLLLNLDTFHMAFEDDHFSSILKKAKNKLRHIHFSDDNRKAPGQGKLDFVTVMNVLELIQYDFYISMEIGYEKNRFEEALQAATFLSSINE